MHRCNTALEGKPVLEGKLARSGNTAWELEDNIPAAVSASFSATSKEKLPVELPAELLESDASSAVGEEL